MVSFTELASRLKEFYNFDRDELVGIITVIFISAFIFSFRDWGDEQFNLVFGLTNFLILTLIASLSLLFRISCQKIYGLSQGQSVRFKIWWLGLFISLIIAFISAGKIPLILAGASASAFMVKQRLGEYRYGFNYWINGIASFWGILGNLILALIFSIAAYFWSYNYILTKAIYFNLIMAFSALIPLPQLDGLNIYFGNRFLYLVAVFTTLIISILLLSRTKIGLVLAIFFGSIAGIIYILIGSEV